MLTWLGADRLRLAGGLDSELRYLRWIVGATLEGILLYYPQLQFGGREREGGRTSEAGGGRNSLAFGQMVLD